MEKMERKELIRWIYLYLFSTIGLVIAVIGAVRLVDLGLKVYVFPKAEQNYYYPGPIRPAVAPDGKVENQPTPEELERQKQEQIKAENENRASQRQREASGSIAMLLIGAPLYWYHWKTIQEDKRK